MSRILAVALSSCLLFSVAQEATAQVRGGLVSQSAALRNGLTRAWFGHVEMDRTRDRVAHVQLFGNTLYVQTEGSVVQAMDAETGEVRWARQIGKRGHFSRPLAATDDYVAVVNGGNLFMVDAVTGRPRWNERLKGAALTGAGISRDRVYVGLVNGLIYSYFLRDHAGSRPWTHDANGRVSGGLLTSSAGVSWGTNRGYTYLNEVRDRDARFTYKVDGGVSAAMTYRKPYYMVGTDKGYAYAIDENSEEALEIFTHSLPVSRPVVAVKNSAYVFALNSGMFKTLIETGEEQWWFPQGRDFIAASEKKIYVADRLGRTHVLDAKSGGVIATLSTEQLDIKMANYATDRIYVGTRDGLIQCLHEIDQKEPLLHSPELADDTDDKKKQPGDKKPEDEDPFDKPPKDEDPFKVDEDPFKVKDKDKGDKDDDPFGGGGDPFGGDGGKDDGGDPFGGGGDDPFKGGGDDPFKAGGDDPFKAGGGGGDPFQ